MAEEQLLIDLLKAGGISALSIGVMYLLYRGILRLGIFPKLKQWQGFTLLCLLTLLVFAVVLTVLQKSTGHNSLMPGELPTENHFEMDAYAGLFCESNNVRDPFVTSFDEVEIYFDKCTNGLQDGSRAYRIDWTPQSRLPISSEKRHNYYQCFASDFSLRAPRIADGIENSVIKHHNLFPCKYHIPVFRGIRISYNNIRNESLRAAFVQSFRDSRSLSMRQIPVDTLVDSASMNVITLRPDGTLSDGELLNLAKDLDPSRSLLTK